ncbi:MAG TPA: hypothetical protein VFO10_12675 [Oligoflexus sp.]|uniref:hypothetical protein n=1 Tax=Oligoflexus sp. TaxID=1971216 RepID=UPI002D7FF0B8|nr:hypothetical protein [Oligoflexus sp.]HET9238105.1 hypothetical protein [Oligoflexus sp.]
MKALADPDHSRLFLSYAALRLRLFLRDILQLHQRFLVAFLYCFGLILSGQEQSALRQGLAHFLSPEPWTPADLIFLGCFLLYSWVVAAVVRGSARGGRVHYFAEAQPLPFAWERLIRALALSVLNLTLLILYGMGFHQLIQNQGAWPMALVWGAAYYVWILGLQLALLEQSWRLFPFWILGAFGLLLSKGSSFAWFSLAASGAIAYWNIQRPESRVHDHPELPIGSWETELRSAFTRRIPARFMMQTTYALVKPALLIYCLLLGAGMNAILMMVLKEDIPATQKIYVYTSITGILSIFLSSFFRSFQLQRQEVPAWLMSLPQPDSWWLRQDTFFVTTFYVLLTLPFSLILVSLQHLSWPVPWLILPMHALGFFLLRSMQRSRHIENSILVILGMCVWFLLLAYLCDHLLQGKF